MTAPLRNDDAFVFSGSCAEWAPRRLAGASSLLVTADRRGAPCDGDGRVHPWLGASADGTDSRCREAHRWPLKRTGSRSARREAATSNPAGALGSLRGHLGSGPD